jgi:hypothetical protein
LRHKRPVQNGCFWSVASMAAKKFEVCYEAKKTGRSAPAVKKAVKKVGRKIEEHLVAK